MRLRVASVLWGTFFLVLMSSRGFALDAFPGAAGYGASSTGGRGGDIIYVTNVDDSGPGSLRECVEQKVKRNCLFRVGGVIHLKSPLGIRSDNGELSILGQTAPGGGITLAMDLQVENLSTPFFLKNTHDVIIRHLKVRMQYPGSKKRGDNITIENSKRVYIDHVSAAWATDEVVSTYADTTDLTIANSIFAEGIMPHSKCALLGSDPEGPQNITFWRNACISNNDRNPDDNHYSGSCIEIANNIFYNARSEFAEVFSQFSGGTPINFLSNYFKAGKNTRESTFAIMWKEVEGVARPRIYQDGNVVWAPKPKKMDIFEPKMAEHFLTEPTCPLKIPVISAEQSYAEVLAQSGAFPRDSVDTRVVAEVGAINVEGTGTIKTEAGNITELPVDTNAYADADNDGIADVKEAELGGSATQSDPWIVSDKDGWTNFDRFMQWLSEERVAGRFVK